MPRLLTPRRAAVAGVLGMALLGAACSSNDTGTTGTQTPAASPTTAAPMTASGPFGAGCSAVPASGAFSALPKPTLDKALGDPKGLLTTVLTYHVVQGQLAPDQLAGSHKTLQGGTLQVSGSGEDFKVNGNSTVVCGNVKTANATVYFIDQVLLPKS